MPDMHLPLEQVTRLKLGNDRSLEQLDAKYGIKRVTLSHLIEPIQTWLVHHQNYQVHEDSLQPLVPYPVFDPVDAVQTRVSIL